MRDFEGFESDDNALIDYAVSVKKSMGLEMESKDDHELSKRNEF